MCIIGRPGSALRRRPKYEEQYELMEGRLFFIIQTPALFLTMIGGVGMLVLKPTWLQSSWMHLKLGLVVMLLVYHISNYYQLKKLRSGPTHMSSFAFRLYNELPTLILHSDSDTGRLEKHGRLVVGFTGVSCARLSIFYYRQAL
ncbi:MAG: CopD family protein [Owenweeksia sp.]|nr:CopD family protein [Owenweeksia sp.]